MRYRILSVAVLLTLVLVFIPEVAMGMTGSGTVGDPYIISDVDDLQDMDLDLSAYYELGNNIDASATTGWNWDAGRGVYEGFEPIGDTDDAFIGHLDGNSYTISDLYMDWDYAGDCYVGLLGELGGVGTVDNVLILDADITVTLSTADGPFVGILVGNLQGDATQVVVSGSVYVEMTSTHSQTQGVGGLVGGTHYSGNIYRCASYADVEYVSTVNDGVIVGGLVGYHRSGVIENCYARGSVTADTTDIYSAMGGLIGYLYYATVSKSYSTGEVSANVGFPASKKGGFLGSNYRGTCTNCFWDTQTSGQPSSACGTGKATAEMKTESTFTDAGWNFSSIWDIADYINDGYPYLQWWYDPTPFVGWDQVLWFEPITIISGTTLPDRAGTAQNGVFTWGANPAGIAIDMGPLVSEGQPPITATPEYPLTPVPDMTGESGQPGWTPTQPTLTDNPFSPLVEMVGDQMNIPIWLVWVIAALLILLLIMLVSYKYAPHQIITALAGGGWSAFMYSMGIFPFWVMFIFAAMALAVIIGERTPTVS